jgi:hypothetical protein
MTDLPSTIAVCLTAAASVGVIAYCFLEWMRGYRRKNDLQDKFQGYERATEQRILALELLDANTTTKLGEVTQRVDNVLISHENLLVRVAQLEDKLKSEVATLGKEVLSEVASMKTQAAAAFIAPSRTGQPRFRP